MIWVWYWCVEILVFSLQPWVIKHMQFEHNSFCGEWIRVIWDFRNYSVSKWKMWKWSRGNWLRLADTQLAGWSNGRTSNCCGLVLSRDATRCCSDESMTSFDQPDLVWWDQFTPVWIDLHYMKKSSIVTVNPRIYNKTTSITIQHTR